MMNATLHIEIPKWNAAFSVKNPLQRFQKKVSQGASVVWTPEQIYRKEKFMWNVEMHTELSNYVSSSSFVLIT